ncbi:hypothetical protein M407DRAFT_119479, partial [Tulasnella calospora MUT 4182]
TSGSREATTPSEEAQLQAPSPPATPPKKTVTEALELLNSLRPEIMSIIDDTGDIDVPLTGLKIMYDNPDEAYMLWTGPGTNNDGSSLWRISLLVFNKFKEAGFIMQTRHLMLRCNLVNSSLTKPRKAFSATEILRRVAEQPEIAGIQTTENQYVTPEDVASGADFGTYGVDQIHLREMRSWDEEKRFVSLGHISLK